MPSSHWTLRAEVATDVNKDPATFGQHVAMCAQTSLGQRTSPRSSPAATTG